MDRGTVEWTASSSKEAPKKTTVLLGKALVPCSQAPLLHPFTFRKAGIYPPSMREAFFASSFTNMSKHIVM